MENRVNRLHRVQKLECDGVSAWLCDDGERPKVCLYEFPREPSGAEVLSFDESLVTDLEVQCWSLSSICRSLVSQLYISHLFTEELMEGVKIDRVFLSSFRGKISFWVDRDVGVVALVDEEGRDANGSVQSIVV